MLTSVNVHMEKDKDLVAEVRLTSTDNEPYLNIHQSGYPNVLIFMSHEQFEKLKQTIEEVNFNESKNV